MIIKDIIEEDFTNYKKTSMFIIFPTCTFKCEKECGIKCCQNSSIMKLPNIEISIDKIVNKYINNDISNAIVLGGLEPFDSWKDLLDLIKAFRGKTNDDIIIFTGYTSAEINDKINLLNQFPNIIIKFGRFIPNQENHFDETLGVYLASNNQYAKKIS